MTDLFETVLNMSITGTVVIFVVILVRLLLKKAPKKYSYALWGLVGFRLCCPFSFKSIISIFNFNPIQSQREIVTNNGTMNYIGTPTAINPPVNQDIATEIAPAPNGITATAGTTSPVDFFTDAAPYLWLMGIAVLIIYAIVSFARLKFRLSTATNYDSNIFQSERIATPFILGIIKPKIYIPYGVDESYLEYVIAHERYHLRRGDNIIKALSFFILAVHWFNPFCWVAFFLMNRDMEMSCDEKVISQINGIKKIYSTALLSFAANKKFPSPSPLCFGEGSVKGRIKNILKYKKPGVFVSVLAMVICIAVALICVANPTDKTENETVNTVASESEYKAYSIGKELVSAGYLSSIIDGTGYAYISDSDILIYDTSVGTLPSVYKSRGSSHTYYTKREFEKYLKDNYLEADYGTVFPLFENVELIQFYSSGDATVAEYTVCLFDGEPYMLLVGNARGFKLTYDENENEKLNDSQYLNNLLMLNDEQREYIDNLFYKMEHPDDVSTNMSSNPYDYIDRESNEYSQLIYGANYTIQYIFEEFNKSGQDGLKGHLMKIVMNDIIGDEAIDISASTGQEYFDAWAKHAFKLYNENSNSQSFYQTTYPYGYLFVTLYGNLYANPAISKFTPFECSGRYYCFDRENIIDEYGNTYSTSYIEETDTYNLVRNGSEIIYTCTDWKFDGIQLYCYIDDSLYFLINDDLYRLALKYNKAGEIYDSEFSLVFENGYCIPVKASKNNLILSGEFGLTYLSGTAMPSRINGKNYISLNTLTGQADYIDYNSKVENNEYSPAVLEETAKEIALKAIQDENNFEKGVETQSPEIYKINENQTVLIKNPDLSNQYVVHYYYPDYAWKITLKGDYIITVYIDADNGNVCAMSVDFLD